MGTWINDHIGQIFGVAMGAFGGGFVVALWLNYAAPIKDWFKRL